MDESFLSLIVSVNKMIKYGEVMRKFSGIRSHNSHNRSNITLFRSFRFYYGKI